MSNLKKSLILFLIGITGILISTLIESSMRKAKFSEAKLHLSSISSLMVSFLADADNYNIDLKKLNYNPGPREKRHYSIIMIPSCDDPIIKEGKNYFPGIDSSLEKINDLLKDAPCVRQNEYVALAIGDFDSKKLDIWGVSDKRHQVLHLQDSRTLNERNYIIWFFVILSFFSAVSFIYFYEALGTKGKDELFKNSFLEKINSKHGDPLYLSVSIVFVLFSLALVINKHYRRENLENDFYNHPIYYDDVPPHHYIEDLWP